MINLLEEQPLVYNTLNNMVIKGHVPHALIFYGDKSVSKKEMALEFVLMLYAKYYNTTIENSPATKRIRDNASTNVHFIKRDKKTIVSIDSILSIIYESSKTSLEEGPIVYIFEDGDSLNINSSNALLKFVEEPKDNVYIVFLVENLSNIIDTIKSRCEILPFKPLNKTRVKDNLDNKGYDPILTKVLVEYSQDEEEIINILNDEELINIYNFITDMFKEKIESIGSFTLYFYEHIALYDEREKIDFLMSLFIIYLRDILSAKLKISDDFIFSSEAGRIKELSTLYSFTELSDFLKEALLIKSNIDNRKSINFTLHMNNLLLMMELKHRR